MVKLAIILTKNFKQRALVTGASCLSAGILVVGPVIAAGLGVADAIWGEYFYDWIDRQF